MRAPFDRERLRQAFELLGADLVRRNLFLEIAVYGGSALMLQFEWRRSTEDVDAVVREGYDEALLAPSVAAVADEMGLDPDWLNNAVGMFTPLHEDEDLFQVSGTFPAGPAQGLRVFIATPHYLLAMKLQALANLNRGERDIRDARRLAEMVGLSSVADLADLYRSIYGEPPPAVAEARFASVLEGQDEP